MIRKNCDIITFVEQICVPNVNLDEIKVRENDQEVMISFRYIIFCPIDILDFFQDLFVKQENVKILCNYHFSSLHYMSFHLLLKSNIAKCCDFYIITDSLQQTDIIQLMVRYHDQHDFVHRIEKNGSKTNLYILSPIYLNIFSIEISFDLFLYECFEFKTISL